MEERKRKSERLAPESHKSWLSNMWERKIPEFAWWHLLTGDTIVGKRHHFPALSACLVSLFFLWKCHTRAVKIGQVGPTSVKPMLTLKFTSIIVFWVLYDEDPHRADGPWLLAQLLGPVVMVVVVVVVVVVVAAFSSLARILGECSTIRTMPAFSWWLFEVEISSLTLIPLCRPGSVHSGSANWNDCGWVFSDKLHVSSFPDRFPHYAWTAA